MSLLGSLATWYFWSYYAAGLLFMACVLALHLYMVRMNTRAPWLLVVGAVLGAMGGIIGGMQAGPYPPMDAAHGVATVRLFWVSGITLGVIAAGLYLWAMKEKQE